MLYLLLFLSVLGFSGTDFLARKFLMSSGLHWHVLTQSWFWLYIIVRLLATGVFLYALSQAELSKSLTIFSMLALIVSVSLGAFLLHEKVGGVQLISLLLALASILVLALGSRP